MNREQLIEKAHDALIDDAWIGHEEALTTYDLSMIVQRVWSVFEEAHAKDLSTSLRRVNSGADSSHVEEANTPTDDEHGRVISDMLRFQWMPEGVREYLTAYVEAGTAPPSDDERDAIIDALLDELGWEWDEVPEEHIPSSREILGDMADRVLAVVAGFHRTEQDATEAPNSGSFGSVQGDPSGARLSEVLLRYFDPATVEEIRADVRSSGGTGAVR